MVVWKERGWKEEPKLTLTFGERSWLSLRVAKGSVVSADPWLWTLWAWIKAACVLPTTHTSQSLPPSSSGKCWKCPHNGPSSAPAPQETAADICRGLYSPPPCSTATMMEGNHDVSLLEAWNSCWRSVKKTPMQEGKPSVSPCSSTAASSTIHAQPRSWGLAAPRAPPWDMVAAFSSQAGPLGKQLQLPCNPRPREWTYREKG